MPTLVHSLLTSSKLAENQGPYDIPKVGGKVNFLGSKVLNSLTYFKLIHAALILFEDKDQEGLSSLHT